MLVRVLDGRGAAAEQHFVLAVTPTPPNRPPLFTTLPVTVAFTGAAYSYDADATDPDGNALTFSLVNPPAGMTVDADTGVITWQPAANQVGEVNVVL